jgi:hypothetical protein
MAAKRRVSRAKPKKGKAESKKATYPVFEQLADIINTLFDGIPSFPPQS